MFQTELFGAWPIFGPGAGKLQTELSGDISGAIFGSGAQYIFQGRYPMCVLGVFRLNLFCDKFP